jgi:hypothetical protein
MHAFVRGFNASMLFLRETLFIIKYLYSYKFFFISVNYLGMVLAME